MGSWSLPTKNYWSLKFKKWVQLVFLLTAVSLSAYMANEGMMCQYLSDMTSNLKFKKKSANYNLPTCGLAKI